MIISLLFMAGFLLKNSSSSTSCSCDITSKSCDPYCCCDTSCSNYKSTWDTKCLEGTILPISDMCSTSSSHTLEAGWRGMKVATDVINRALCIAFDNSPLVYNNFDEITTGTTGRDYNTTSSRMTQSLSVKTSGSLTAGGFLYAQMGTDNMNLWTLPTPDPYGKCWYSSPVRFMESLEKNTCSYLLSSTNDCSQLSINIFTTELKIATNNDFDDTASINNVLYIKRASNGKESVSSSELTSSVSGTTCINVVVSANYTLITNTAQTSISKINIQLTVMDLELADEVDIPVTTQVRYLTNTDEIIYKSGNPGYQIGMLLNTGYLLSDTSIMYYENGFQIPGVANTGACQDGTFSKGPFLRFGQDLIVTCYKEMDYSELQAYCKDLVDINMFFDGSLLTSIGKYGNITYSYPEDWVTIISETSNGMVFDSGTCDIPTLVYYITYASIGNARNPQYKIIYAQKKFAPNVWVFRMQDKTAKQKFFFTLSINFIEYTKEISNYFPPAPNPLPVMPDDILYPFKISNAELLAVTLFVLLVY